MKKSLYIKNWTVIRKSQVFRNNSLIFEDLDGMTLPQFLKSLYYQQKFQYPKFFKMDLLSKLGFTATEILFGGEIEDKNTALIFANAASSLQTDEKYFESMNNFPSPSLFVYTLPNIMLGEISIRHQLKSENIFFVTENFDAEVFVTYVKGLFMDSKLENIVCGYVNLHNNDYDVFLWHIARNGQFNFNEEELNKLYLPTHE